MINISTRIFISILLIASQASCAGSGTEAGCMAATPALAHMQQQELHFRIGKQNLIFSARIADEGQEKAAGFQYICPAAYADTRILFVYDNEIRAMFHMRNVHDNLDIGFFDADGRLFEVQQMQHYPEGAKSGPRTVPSRPFRFALETRTGFFAENKMLPGETTLQWPD